MVKIIKNLDYRVLSTLSIKFFNIFKRIRSLSLSRHETTRIALPKGVTSYYVVDLSFFQSDKIKLQQYEKTFGTLHLLQSIYHNLIYRFTLITFGFDYVNALW